jgi:hypothetical protein
MIRDQRLPLALAFVLLGALHTCGRAEMVTVDRYKTLELIFNQATTDPANPFDTYLLRLELTDPDGQSFEIDGFYAGDGMGGLAGTIWKARISPSKTGTWSWQTVRGDADDPGLAGLSGQFDVTAGTDRGGVVAAGRYFEFDDGSPTYLVGNFLDLSGVLNSTHVYMSETISDADRNAIIARQTGFHDANKANIYLANKGDYGSRSVTPWIGSASSNDKTRMDVARWKTYDDYIRRFKDNEMLAELWFFADDSNFSSLPLADQQRLIRYGMARTSAFSHTLYTLALEWQEGFSKTRINQLGSFLQDHNPWDRAVSVHSLNGSNWEFANEAWPTFMATQIGNSADPDDVNAYGITIRGQDVLPHIDEEFGLLFSDSDTRLRGNLWANLASGAAGGGTGSDLGALQRFLEQSNLPFRRMTPHNGLVSRGGSSRFALAEAGHHYLVYSENGSFNLTLSGSGLEASWFNPRDPGASLGAPFAVSAGPINFTPPASTTQDWVLWVTDGTNPDPLATHPSGDAELVQHHVVGGPSVEARPILAWEFNTDDDHEGWSWNSTAGDQGVSAGTWNLAPSGIDPMLTGPTFSESADLARIIEIRMSSTETNTSGQVFWTVAGDAGFSAQRSRAFTLLNDGQFHDYWFNFSADPDWTDTITQLRLDPVAHGNGGDVSIDFIRLMALIVPGDVNRDGDVNGLDVDPFVDRLLAGTYQHEADINGDGQVNGLDVDPFVAAVLGGGGADTATGMAVPEPSASALAAAAFCFFVLVKAGSAGAGKVTRLRVTGASARGRSPPAPTGKMPGNET